MSAKRFFDATIRADVNNELEQADHVPRDLKQNPSQKLIPHLSLVLPTIKCFEVHSAKVSNNRKIQQKFIIWVSDKRI